MPTAKCRIDDRASDTQTHTHTQPVYALTCVSCSQLDPGGNGREGKRRATYLDSEYGPRGKPNEPINCLYF